MRTCDYITSICEGGEQLTSNEKWRKIPTFAISNFVMLQLSANYLLLYH